ncbi:MAG: Fe-S cluster assembly ATPase SufC [Clostridiales bacterium]|nr:Fe-S cluster assembly ATPase SufC [Clostridiales bacterium]
MSEPILEVDRLTVRVEDKEILHGIDLAVRAGETHVLMGPNGAGKSTLGYVLMGNPKYQVESGTIWFQGKDVTQEPTDKRAREGMFLSFQEPLEVPGLSLEGFLKNAVRQKNGGKLRVFEFRKELRRDMETLQLDDSYGERSLNVGFSGGEKKKSEILQLMMLKPALAILDETDSGLDVDAVRLVSEGVKEYQRTQEGALLIITHSTRILEALHVDYTHVMVDGRIVATGDGSLVDQINENGYESFLEMTSRGQEV